MSTKSSNIEQISWFDLLNLSEEEKNILLTKITHVRLGSPWYETALKQTGILNSSDTSINKREEVDKKFEAITYSLEDMLSTQSFINSPFSLRAMRNKQVTANLLKFENIPHPDIFQINNLDDLKEISSMGTQLILKPKTGSMGVGIFTLEPNLNLYKLGGSTSGDVLVPLSEREKVLEELINQGNYLFQRRVDLDQVNNKNYDVRYLCSYGDIIGYYARVSENSLATNISLGSKLEKVLPIPKDNLAKAEKYVSSLGDFFKTNVYAVDVIFDKNSKEPYILELNAFPGIEGPTQLGINPYINEIKFLQSFK